MDPEVDCYAGFRGDERPLRFMLGGVEHEVMEVLEQYYGPHDLNFKVLSEDGRVFLLTRSRIQPEGGWRIEELRRTP